MKKILITILTCILTITCFLVNTNNISAAGYKVEVVRGFGKNAGKEKATTVMVNAVDTGYSLYGYFGGGEVNQEGSTKLSRYSQKTYEESYVTGVDAYYGNKSVYGVTGGVYVKGDGELGGTTTSNSEKIARFSISQGAFYCRFQYISADLTLVLHYSNEDTITINNVASTYLNDVYEKYYKQDNSYLLSKGYSDTEGFLIQVEKYDKDVDSIEFNIGDKFLSLSNFDQTYYLSKDYLFSNTHSSEDILGVSDKGIVIYNYNEKIDIDYKYRYTITLDALDGKFEDGESVKELYTTLGRIQYPKDPKRNDYLFSGWYDLNNYKIVDKQFNDDEILKAGFVKNIYDITFDFAGLKENETVTIGEGYLLPEKEVANIPGYAFMGWYSDSEYKKAFDFTKTYNQNMTIYGKFEKVITVTFHNVDSISSISFDARVNGNGFFDEENNKFYLYGPSTIKNGLNVIINNLEGDIKDISFTNGKKKATIKQSEIKDGVALYINKNYKKRKWENSKHVLKFVRNNKADKDEAFSLTFYNIKEDIDVYVNYEDVNVTYVVEGVKNDLIVPYNSLFDLEIEDREASVFSGWYLDEDHLNKYELEKPITKPITLYAKFDIIHKISFIGDAIKVTVGDDWKATTGGENGEDYVTFVGDYNDKKGVPISIHTDITKMKALEIDYAGFKVRIDKEDLFGTHYMNLAFEFIERAKYEEDDILKTYLGKDATSILSMRFYKIKSDMKISVIN